MSQSAASKPTLQGSAHRPYVIGLTGNIGTGKSTVARMLAELGAYVIDADRVAHQVMEPGEPAYAAVVDEFGPDIAPTGGPIDRQRLGAIVFADPGALAQLEKLVHPAVFERVRWLLNNTTARVAVIEAIKLLEAGLSLQLCDAVWVVTAPRDQQLRRLIRDRSLTREEALLRIDAQPPQEEKVALADVVIDNGGSLEDTSAQVKRAWKALVLTAGEDNSTGNLRKT